MKKILLVFTTVSVLALFSGLLFFSKSEELEEKPLVEPTEEKSFIETTVESVVETVNRSSKCPLGQKYIDYNRPDVPGRCYTPAPDAGKTCESSSDCASGKCWVELDDPLIEKCDPQPGINHCPGVSGTCGDGSKISGIRIKEKDYVLWDLKD